MTDDVPSGARPAARVLLLSDCGQILLLSAQLGLDRFWITPGGGVQPGESFQEAAARELFEETGQRLTIEACVWRRRHASPASTPPFDQYERFFVAHTTSQEVAPAARDSYVTGHRWWRLEEIHAARDVFAPARLGDLLEPILRGEYPRQPFDCGI